MDVNRAPEGILVAGFRPCQPHDPSDYGIATGCIRLEDLACGTAGFKNRTKRCVIANFLGDLEASDGRTIASRAVAESKFRSGNLVGFDRTTIADQKHFLVAHADDHFIPTVLTEGECLRPAAREGKGRKDTQRG